MKSLFRLLLIVAGVSFIGACGDDDDGGTTTPDARTADAPLSTVDAGGAAADAGGGAG